MSEYIINTDYNDGYTAPELHNEAVMLVKKLDPIPLIRCKNCGNRDWWGDCPMWTSGTHVSVGDEDFCSQAIPRGDKS